jgi:DNA-binding response OmpR family regulator
MVASVRVQREGGAAWHTSRERELLEFFAARPNQVVTHTEIEQAIWHLGSAVISHAPAVAIRRLRQKIEPKGSRPVNLLTMFGDGWKLVVRT